MLEKHSCFKIIKTVCCVLTPMFYLYLLTPVFAISPPFAQQEIIDEVGRWIDLNTKEYSAGGDRNTDIVSVSYSSNGTSLDAILWLLLPFKENPTRENLNYGMFVDADFNSRANIKTGFGGIDYQIEIRWNNETKKWNKFIEAWSPYGETRVIENNSDYKGFYEKGGNYVLLSADLGKILYPQKYKVLYYAESKKGGSYKSDYTRWVAIPPLELVVSPSPNSLEVTRGEQKSIEVKVNSTQGYEPTVNVYTLNQSHNIGFNFAYKALRIPSYGMSSTPLTVNVSKDALAGPYTLFIFANSTFPPEELLKPKTGVNASDFRFSIPTENIVTQSSMLVTVKDPPELLESISLGWEKLGGPIGFVYGIIAGISPWLYSKVAKLIKARKNTKGKSTKAGSETL